MKQILKKSVMVEMTFNSATQTTFPFPDVPFLRHKKITGIALSLSRKCLNSGNDNLTTRILDVTDAYFRSIFATFVDNNGIQFLQNIPIVEFSSINYSNSNISIGGNLNYINNTDGFFELAPRAINFPKSYIFIPEGWPLPNGGLMFQFFYEEMPKPLVPSDIFKKVFNYQFVSLQVNTLASKYYFADQPNLRDAKIQKIHAYLPSVIKTDPNKVQILNGPGGSLTDSNNFLTLHNNGVDLVKEMDLTYLQPFEGQGLYSLNEGSLNVGNLIVDFSKSYMQVSKNGPVYTTPFCYGFGIFYTK
jgi:hypothetical protein